LSSRQPCAGPINPAPTDRPIFSPRPGWRSHRPREG
jgi:hypothetical protein